MNINERIQSLTIEEKIGQMMQLAPFFFIKDLKQEVFGWVKHLGLTEEKIFTSGSVLGIGSAKEMIEVQKTYLKKSTSNIPLLFMADIIHGYKTIFPVPIAIASTFNPDLAFDVARISAIEASTAGIHVTFSPMADVSRDPRWGRVVESFGEDPYLNYHFAKKMVEGYQNKGVHQKDSLVACVKHFAGYGLSEAGRDYNTVDISKIQLYNDFLHGYQGALDGGAKMVMTAFNTIDRIPCTINFDLLQNVLRHQMGFDGVIVSDYDSLHQVIAHGMCENEYEAAKLGVQATLDIEMASTCYVSHVKKLIEDKKISIKQVDDAVIRILKLKEDVGLFDHPYKGADEELEQTLVLSEKHLKRAHEIALESAVLLKNDEKLLPLSKKTKIALIGPLARNKDTNGPWSWHGNTELNTPLDQALVDHGFNMYYVCDTYDLDIEKILTCDVVLIAIGESSNESGEAHSKTNIDIPKKDSDLIDQIKALGKKVVTILYNGRPLILTSILSSDAILETWFLGSKGNEAIAQLLSGMHAPSGRLPMSMPYHQGQIPIYYNHLNTGRPQIKDHPNPYVSFYMDAPNTPLFPFGFGLSYAHFIYENMQLSKHVMMHDETIKASITVTNQSDIDGFETIQLYIRDLYAQIARPVKELKQVKKIWFKAHERIEISFEISIEDLIYKSNTGQTVYDSGDFHIMIGKNALDTTCLTLKLANEEKL